MFSRIVKSLTALVVLMALLVGAPIALWTFGRSLLPTKVPSWSAVWDALWSRDDGTLFLSALLIVGVVAWLVFAVCVIVELAAMLAGQRGRWHLPGMRMPQRAVSALLAMIFTGSMLTMSVGTAAASPVQHLPAAVHASASSQQPAHLQGHSTSDRQSRPVKGALANGSPRDASAAPSTTGPVWTVQRYDTLWSIAEKSLGNGRSFQTIAELNIGVTQPDGKMLHTADTPLEVGWQLRLPAGAKLPEPAHVVPVRPATSQPTTVTVEQGGTLSQIAQDELGDADRYPELAKANHLGDPNLIEVGQTIIIPAPSRPDVQTPHPAANPHHVQVPVARTAPHPAAPHYPVVKPAPKADRTPPAEPASPGQHHQVPAAPRHTQTPAPTPDASPRAPVGQAQEDAGSPAVTPSRVPASSAPSSVTIGAPTAETATTAGQFHSTNHNNTIALLGMSAAAAAAAWAGLVLARRRNNRRRRPGRMTPPPSLDAVRMEKALRERAGTVDIVWLDLALRSLGTVLADQNSQQMPDIIAAQLSNEGLRLQLADALPAPAPFVMDGSSWWLPAAAELPISQTDAVDQLAPLPTLTSIGSLGEQTVLVDLEHAGSITVQGDAGAARAFLNHLVVELAHQSWSDGVNVSLVGWGEHLTSLNPERLTYSPDVAAVLRHLQTRVGQVSAALDELHTNVVAARIRDMAGDSWMPQILLVDAAGVDDELLQELHQQLSTLSSAGRVATAVVVSGVPEPQAPVIGIQLAADGTLTIPALLGAATLTAAALTHAELAGLLNLFDNAEQVDAPNGPCTIDEPWADHIDDSGALMPPITLDEPVEIWQAAQTGVDEPELDQTPAARAVPAPIVDPPAHVDAAAAAQLDRVLAADPQLDADFAEWSGQQIVRPRISILGPARVIAPGEMPKRQAWFTEVAVYLALHRRGVSLEKFHADLWPAKGRPGEGRPIARTTRNETASKVRKWMGVHPATGETFMPLGTDGVYQLDSRLLDIELLRRLRERGDARAAAADPRALDDYVAALNLVRGPVLPESMAHRRAGEDKEGNWAWLANDDRREDILVPGWIVDTAHRTVQVAIAGGDLDLARWAANLAHDVDPYSDTPLLDLLVIAAAAGDMATANRHAWEVLWANGAEVPEDLPSDTCVVINRIFPTGLRAVSS